MTAADDRTGDQAEYDVVVLGAGPTGENLADRVHAAGLTAVVVESELVGGECSYWACMPSKALLRPVVALAEAGRVGGARQAVTGSPDVPAVLERRDAFASHWKDDGQVSWLESAGIDLVRGHGRLDGERRVVVTGPDGGERVLTARHAVAVCTGSGAALPPLPGIEEARPWTSREAVSAKEAPRRLAVVGGGVVAVEMATAWRALGSEVTLLVRGDGLLPRLEPFAGELVAKGLTEAGVTVRTGVSVTGLSRADAAGPVTLTLDDGGRLDTDEILFATGRFPRTADLGLDSVGLEPGSWLTVDDTCRVTAVEGGWLYAAGDVNHRALLTHQGKYQARIAGAVIAARAQGEAVQPGPWGPHAATADSAAVPAVVFTDPEVASVGLSAADAEREGRRIRVVDHDLGAVAGAALFADGYRGQARMVVDLDRGHLVGATFVGSGVGELLHSATVAIAGEVPVERLWHAVPSYPTISEIWLRLLETYRG
ncbi:dihydrolipoyl dehydrogenase family protein [Streptantibioticus silvisoli]|uniref:NAD(P)/FAD-dependent oxidoreductase n=1 Tax=Streptantibioticus silvisoli TaxID=2705255 RepID=A0ABT6VVG9_9ACTN|nr:NAD(P)/FAD-dependent oxidoreductase [Streptantibioticus silvisoli]MDI5962140.1 NAD(P)/FAD-dependent oxidoreductase [Streptantibioticus silvisoli]